jgi:hypothetical protein
LVIRCKPASTAACGRVEQEFENFFDNPPTSIGETRNLNRLQMAYFAAHALAGWVLGFFLLAAMGGLTQKTLRGEFVLSGAFGTCR